MKGKLKKITDFTQDKLFQKIHGKQLIYNTCWEDPRIDRLLLKINRDSRIVMITSAGCNALDYLFDQPSSIFAVDLNPRQNALLELKKSFFISGLQEELWEFFGEGASKNYNKVFGKVKDFLPIEHRAYWNDNISYFHLGGVKKTFYYRGTAGSAAWIFRKCLLALKKKKRKLLTDLFECETLDQQREIYEQVEKSICNFFLKWFVKQPYVMAMLGVPRPQIQLIKDGYGDGLFGYVRDKIRHVLTNVPISENYFWRVYMH